MTMLGIMSPWYGQTYNYDAVARGWETEDVQELRCKVTRRPVHHITLAAGERPNDLDLLLKMSDTAHRIGPLAGIRVIDLTAMVMGPYCTQIMADMGAEVIKVEAPAGDNTRYISDGPAPGMSGVFVNVNRGKRSIVLNLKTETDRATLRTLIGTADVFIHSMRTKAIRKLGFDYTSVAAINPAIVYTGCYGYGRDGPERDQAAYDDTIQAECGIPAVQAMLTGSANFFGTIIADKVSGLTALYATVMALFHRQRSGEGQEVEVGMFETMASFMLVEHANGAMFDPPIGPARYPRAVAPNRRPYRTADGHIAALVYNDKQWAAFVEAVQPEWAGPELANLGARARDIDRIYARLADTFLTRTTDEWLTLLRTLEIPATRLNTPDDLFENEHLNAVGFFEVIDSPYGPIRFPGIPTSFSRTPGRVAGSAPELGADTEAILRQVNGVRCSVPASGGSG